MTQLGVVLQSREAWLIAVAIFGEKKKSSGKKRRVCQSLLSLAIDLFAQHEIVVARAKARDSRFVPCNCEAKCGTIC
jgi:hypothetical protein